MDASEKMKYKLANGMKELLVHTPVDKITVKQIVDQCDVTRPTFYRHFKDKYDLINWYFDVLAQMSFKQMGISMTSVSYTHLDVYKRQIPFWSGAVQEALAFNENAQIAGCELSRTFEPDFDPEDPYDAMARRMVYHGLNGSAVRRIEAGIRHAKDVKADGAVWFGHWGCKHTLGAAQLAKKKFEEARIPMLLLDGDGCDRSHGGEGQTSTRLGAFLEMLGAEEMEGGQDE